jgi:hypothetical protein
MKTPIRAALAPTSPLRAQTLDGLQALKSRDRRHLVADVHGAIADSLDIDEAFRSDHPAENRWDYLLGHEPSGGIVGLEPHTAKQDEVSTVIRKKEEAKQQLSGHLKPGKRVSKWLWVASGKNHFANTERTRRRLDEHGIDFVGGRILARHLA